MSALVEWITGRKASAATRAIVQTTGGARAIWTPRNYADFAKEGYKKNVWTYRSVTAITAAAKGVPWKLYRIASDGRDLEIDSHELLALWEKPNPVQGHGSFVESAFGFWLISGDSYIEGVFVGDPKTAPPVELWTLRPDRMKIRPDLSAVDGVGGYVYDTGRSKQEFDAEQILHSRLFNPLNDWYGMSPLEAAAYSVDQHNASGAWNKALLDRHAKPSGILNVEDALDETQLAAWTSILEERFGGKANAGRPMLLDGGKAEWTPTSLSPVDMDWLEGRKEAAHEIVAAFGVPPEIVGLLPATYQNRLEAKKALYTEVVLPLLDHFRDDVNRWLTVRYGDGLRLDYDRDGIEALQDDRDKVYSRIGAANWLTVDEKRIATGHDALPNGIGEVLMVPLSTQMLPINEPLSADDDEDAEDEMPTESQDDDEGDDDAKSLPVYRIETADAKALAWKSIDVTRQRWETIWVDRVSVQLASELRRIVAAIERADDTPYDAVRAATAAVRKSEWRTLLVALSTATAEDFGERTLDGLGFAKSSRSGVETKSVGDVFRRAVAVFVKKHTASQAVAISDATRKHVRKTVEQAFADGGDSRAAADALRESGWFTKVRADRIARTEVLFASSTGQQEAARSTGLDLVKTWVATMDQRTREDHAIASGQTVPLDEPYDVGGASMMHPGDPDAPADEVVNCRCAETYGPADSAAAAKIALERMGRLIVRPTRRAGSDA